MSFFKKKRKVCQFDNEIPNDSHDFWVFDLCEQISKDETNTEYVCCQ